MTCQHKWGKQACVREVLVFENFWFWNAFLLMITIFCPCYQLKRSTFSRCKPDYPIMEKKSMRYKTSASCIKCLISQLGINLRWGSFQIIGRIIGVTACQWSRLRFPLGWLPCEPQPYCFYTRDRKQKVPLPVRATSPSLNCLLICGTISPLSGNKMHAFKGFKYWSLLFKNLCPTVGMFFGVLCILACTSRKS